MHSTLQSATQTIIVLTEPMCGFAGIVYNSTPSDPRHTQELLQQMGDRLIHRGPDDNQLRIDGHIGLVFRRLSIVDVQDGSQPMANEDGSLLLVVNGEIYNHLQLRSLLKQSHTFRTRSDSEIILHLYEEMGEAFLEHLNGMFALALWDRKLQKVFIARDRLGIKPLYYHKNRERLIFGSEIKALLAHPDCPREVNWHEGLSHSISKPNTGRSLPSFFTGIIYLKGGWCLTLDLRTKQEKLYPYWSLPQPTADELADDARSATEIIRGYRDLLEDSVQLQMMSDVPIGLFLSGGIDSVSIARIASKFASIPTYTVLTQSTFQNGDVRAAAAAARQFGLDNHQVVFKWHDHHFDADYWKRLLWHLETPLCSAEQLYKYELHRYAKHHFPELKCMLLGQGSDEFNGGYAELFENTGSATGFSNSDVNKWDEFMQRLTGIENHNLFQDANAALLPYAHLLDRSYLADSIGYNRSAHPWLYHASMYSRTLQVYNLWHEDRTSSAHGVESRVPFLDHRLVEYCMRIPEAHHRNLFWNKEILRKGFEGKIPDTLVRRPKVPFFHGEDLRFTYRMLYSIMVSNNRQLIYEAIGEPDYKHPILNRAAVEQLVDHIGQDVEFSEAPILLMLVNMGLLEKMIVQTSFAKPQVTLPVVAERLVINDFDSERDTIALRLGIRREDKQDRQAIKIADNVKILQGSDGIYYIAVDDVLEYSLDTASMGDWVKVLQSFDGKRTLMEILSQLDVSEATIRVRLEEALDFNIVQLC
ncbi:MAG: asparagine synthase (glutamine-hydrolyzing) [Gorillibacterium sp.]|nr:asparagine synthase (glutamine-hydrolyzing) [Gorillibacterium sp.]